MTLDSNELRRLAQAEIRELLKMIAAAPKSEGE